EALALLVVRNGRETLLPRDDFALADGDEILFAGRGRARRRMTVTLNNRRVLYYVRTGREPPRRWQWGYGPLSSRGRAPWLRSPPAGPRSGRPDPRARRAAAPAARRPTAARCASARCAPA